MLLMALSVGSWSSAATIIAAKRSLRIVRPIGMVDDRVRKVGARVLGDSCSGFFG